MSLKVFKSAEEIKALPGYKPNNPVSLERFSRFLGHYTLKPALKCCVAEKASLCMQAHNRGWVVALKDESVSIIGIDCAKNKFDSDDGFKSKRIAAERSRQQDDIHKALGSLLVNKDHDMKRLKSTISALEELDRASSTLREALGDSLTLALLNLHQRTSGSVQVTTYAEQQIFNKVAQATQIRDVRVLREIGRIRVPESLSHSQISNLRDTLAAAEMTYASIDKLEKKPLPKLATHFSRTINAVYPASLRIEELQKQLRAFIQGDLSPLYFVATTESDKVRVAQLIAELRGSPISQSEARRSAQVTMARIRMDSGIRSRPHEDEDF